VSPPFLDPAELPPGEPKPGWVGRFFSTERLTIAYYEIAADAVPVHEHQHPQEEVWNVLEGELLVTVDGEERVVAAGGAVIVPADTPHSARALGPCRAIVVDAPSREEIGGVRPHRAV